MRFLSLLTLLFLLFSTGSCEESGQNCLIGGFPDAGVREIDNLSSVIKDYRYVRLETNDSCLIGRTFGMGKIVKYNNRFYIADGTFGKKICIFDNDGKYLTSLSRSGNGPGEYSMITDFDISDREIVIIDADKMLFYSADDNLPYIRTVELDFIPWNIKWLKENEYCVYASRTDSLFHIIDDTGKIIQKGFPADLSNGIRRTMPFVPLKKEKASVIVQSGYSNDIIRYDIERKTFSEMKLFAGSSFLDARQENEYIKKYSYGYGEHSDADMIISIASNAEHLIAGISRKFLTNKYYVVNLSDNAIRYLITENTCNDITYTDICEFFNITGSTWGEDRFISYAEPYKLAESLSGNRKFENEKQYEWLKKNFGVPPAEDENPVLVEFSFK